MPLDKYDQIAHLLRRAGFGAHPDEIEQKVARGLEATVDDLINFEKYPDVEPDEDLVSMLDLPVDEFNRMRGTFIGGLERWWLNAMITTKRPLVEKMTLFWHNLFATSIAGLPDPRQMYLQNENFRGNFEPETGQIMRPNPRSPFPLGNFRLILEYLTKDPAMLFWLDNWLNRKLNSEVGTNENYARELHELFSMGVEDVVAKVPNYTERDIRQASRALTGWTILRGRRNQSTFPRQFVFDARNHDFGPYEHLGQRGGTNADFIFDNIVRHRNPGQQQSAVGRFLGYRLFIFFGYDDPEPEIINALADVFDGAHGEQPYSIRNMLRTIFTPGNVVSEAFYSERAFKAHVKSPTEYIVGAFRLLNFDRQSGEPDSLSKNRLLVRTLINAMIGMGQYLLFPPDVSGWKEGLNWINTTFDLARFNFANAIATGLQARQGGIDVDRIMDQNDLRGASASEIVDFFARLLLQAPLSPGQRQTLIDYLNAPSENATENTPRNFVNMKVRGLIHLIMTMPEFQLS